MNNENEKQFMQGLFRGLDKELKNVNNTCDAGLVFQKLMYGLKKAAETFKNSE